MLKENWRFISRLERLGDNLIILASFFAAYYGRSSFLFWDEFLGLKLPFRGEELAPLRTYYPVIFVALPLYNFILTSLGAYSRMRLATSWQLFRISIVSSLVVFFGIAAILFILKLDLSRIVLGLFCVLVSLFLAVERYAILMLLRYWRSKGRNFRNILIVGVGEQAKLFASQVTSRKELGIRLVGFGVLDGHGYTSESRGNGALALKLTPMSGRVFSGIPDIERAVQRHAVDEVIFTEIVSALPQAEELMLILSEQGVRVTIAADLFSVGMIRSEVSYFGNIPLIHYQPPPGDSSSLAVKRGLDILLSACLLLLSAPLMGIIAIGVKLSSPGPILFRQKRVGLAGRIFSLYKFRSMTEGAERKLEELRANNEMRGPAFKIKDDPRITKFGKFLRRYSLDELPQLWNVFRGDMSLVGPRPPVPGEVNQYVRRYRRRLSMRPGLTCTWQVSGRNEIIDFENWVKLDLEYIDSWSLLGDLKILLKTIPAVLRGTGA